MGLRSGTPETGVKPRPKLFKTKTIKTLLIRVIRGVLTSAGLGMLLLFL